MTMRRFWIVLLLLFVPLAQAATVHAFLDRSHVSLGDTVTLNIRSDGSLGSPDLSPIQQDFQVLGTSRSSSVQIVNGKTTGMSQLGIALKPLHAGTLTIPSLDVGGAKTQPLTLQVGAAPSGGTGKVGGPAFMEAGVLSSSPYVGQQTVYTVRLFYLPGVDGALGNPSADGARLVNLDRDHRYVTQRDGYTYKVIERSWALIPQRSGPISVQGPEFQGRRLGAGSPNAWFNGPNALLNNPNALLNTPLPGFGTPVHALAPITRIDARAAPASAGKPWLPARNVQLKLSGLPSDGKVSADTPLTVTLAISASGVPADALPEPELPPIAGARVYPDQTRDSTDDSGQWLQGSRTRSFAIVPDRDGVLSIPAITLDWWDVTHDRAEQAKLPAHTLEVSGAVAGSSAPVAPSSATTVTSVAGPAATGGAVSVEGTVAASATVTRWRDIALASLALWLLAIVAGGLWWLRRRRMPATEASGDGTTRGVVQAQANVVSASATEPLPQEAPAARVDPKALQRSLMDAARAGDSAKCEHALLAWARASHPGIAHAGALRNALSDPAQRDALDALQRARWQGADPASACAAVARAFARGFGWRDDGEVVHRKVPDLPPLYPPT